MARARRFVIHKHAASRLHHAVARRNPTSSQPRSVTSGRTIEQVGSAE